MTLPIVALIAGAVIAFAGALAFLLIVISIQVVDRSSQFMNEPRNFLDASTRRLLGSTNSVVIHQTKEG